MSINYVGRVSVTRHFFAMLLLSLISFGSYATENTIQISQENLDTLGVKLGKPEPVTQFPVLSAPAKVVIPSSQEYIVSAAQAGFIEKLNAAIGDKVAKGQVLAQLNSPDLLTLQREYLKADSAMQLAAAIYQRDKKLLEEGVIADRRWQETSSQYHSAVSETDEHKQLLGIAGMTVSEIERFGKTHRLTPQLNIRAPIAGVVMERLAVVGTHTDIMAPLYRIANLDELWLEIAIPQERVGSIKIGDRVLIENSDFSAKITLLGQSVNPENQTILARAVVQTHNLVSLRAGQRLNTRIIQPSDKAAFKVPNVAIAQNEGKAFIFIRTQQGFSVTPVTVVGKQGDESIISGELTGDEEIAVKGAVALKANWLGLGSDE
ncbi:efflux RND transporter periplasmic adaptor subunit [Methylobacter sp.]|uniref:efflux RND transporter periplasmic adaptor subunit n=1 Tax=Methylobacter sp. TaxID=2051955 RepID=UPI0024889DF5|nr:efflux RND transporter periplasmic adaptor subunit [Methylobacter sp.]MDI1276903.1 efflux RND transporter periplasmic adaptor subunit [Methylobacter sp.]MDI1359408.1 efflux RND transporter periplasmic adaptor subunit [Methylobacter sp.]